MTVKRKDQLRTQILGVCGTLAVLLILWLFNASPDQYNLILVLITLLLVVWISALFYIEDWRTTL